MQSSAEQAQQLITRALQKADQIGVAVCIAVVDSGSNLTAFLRMDGAFLGSVDVAIRKAKTACLFPLPTQQFGELIQQERLLGMELTNQGLIGFAGGEPVFVGDEIQGAIGISGGTAEQDAAIAEFALNAV